MIKKIIVAFCALILFGCSAVLDYEPVTFNVTGDSIEMNGVIDSHIKSKLQRILNENPQVTTIVMQNVEGSVDDVANLEAARLVRKKGLNTHIPGNGLVTSGGTDFFLAGKKRTIEKGARIGVHSWGGFGVDDAAKLPKSDPEHQKYLQYYKEMGINSEFYWYTLNSAPNQDIHWMTPAEIKKYQITSQ
ncbi:COG3904 family protein [Endozoicomonas euniceicola]|uniref:Alpha/beta hydrolase n=1 Tax=Endozoicomonas euniceicola TaxID=1234143 RepID=A0ABY6GW13_9GAMM|nr:hypothetical protein [Endozoicomonas euniceicola]UYM16599.1 hypothetical protein NX720_01315 [Endozoicomonas euniceicola]